MSGVALLAFGGAAGAAGGSVSMTRPLPKWEFPKIGVPLFWGPYSKDPTI